MLPLVFAALLAIDPAQSSARFSVPHIFVERVSGTVAIKRGSIEIPAGSRTPSKVHAELDATSLHTDDPDRDASLKGPDWFDTGAFPTWTFDSTNIVQTNDGFSMTGFITIHGVAQSETLSVVASGTSEHPIYHATCSIDRHAFGMKTSRLDGAIGNVADVTLDIRVR